MCLGTVSFLIRTEHNIHLVEVYRSIAPDRDLTSGTQALPPKCWDWQQLTHPSLPCPRKGLCWRASRSLGCFRAQAIQLFAGPCIKSLSAPKFSVVVFGLVLCLTLLGDGTAPHVFPDPHPWAPVCRH